VGKPRPCVKGRGATMNEIGVAAERARGRRSAKQSGGEFASAVSTTGAGDAALSKSDDAAEVQLSSCPGGQLMPRWTTNSIRSAISSLGKSTTRNACLGRVASPCSVDHCSRADASPHVQSPHCLDSASRFNRRGPDRHRSPIASAAGSARRCTSERQCRTPTSGHDSCSHGHRNSASQ
jgi:hypothetical protein